MTVRNTVKTLRQFPAEMRLYTQKEDPFIQLRIPSEMLLELTLCAIETGHSVEAEMIVRLAHSLSGTIPGAGAKPTKKTI